MSRGPSRIGISYTLLEILESCIGRKTLYIFVFLRILYLKVFQLPWNLIWNPKLPGISSQDSKDSESRTLFYFVTDPSLNVHWCVMNEIFIILNLTIDEFAMGNVTGPAKINHVSANYTELYFRQYLQLWTWYPISVNFRRNPIKFCISDRDFIVFVQTVCKLW